MILGVDAAHWAGPFGWLYRNTPGNLVASAVWGPIGFGLGTVWAHHKIVLPMRRHHAGVHDRLERIESKVAGEANRGNLPQP